MLVFTRFESAQENPGWIRSSKWIFTHIIEFLFRIGARKSVISFRLDRCRKIGMLWIVRMRLLIYWFIVEFQTRRGARYLSASASFLARDESTREEDGGFRYRQEPWCFHSYLYFGAPHILQHPFEGHAAYPSLLSCGKRHTRSTGYDNSERAGSNGRLICHFC